MKRGLLASWLLLCFLAGAAAEATFAPEGRVVDHVVVMREHRPSRTRVVTSGADWFRVDLDPGGPAATTTCYDHPATLSTTVSRRPSGEYATLGIRRGLQQDRDASLDYNAYPTGEQQTFLGESCRVWNVMRRRADAPAPFAKLSCVTDDGIELWYELGGGSIRWSAEATRIERRPVQPSEVLPPADLLNLNSWLGSSLNEAGSAARLGDYAMEMTSVQSLSHPVDTAARTLRRHHPWTWTEERRANGGTTLLIENKPAAFHLNVERNAAGEFRTLSMIRLPPDAPPQHGVVRLRGPEPFVPPRTETILSEHCVWFNMHPDMMDAGISQCLTVDEIPLKESRWSRGRQNRILQAVRLERRNVELNEVLPSGEMLSRRTWGLPE